MRVAKGTRLCRRSLVDQRQRVRECEENKQCQVSVCSKDGIRAEIYKFVGGRDMKTKLENRREKRRDTQIVNRSSESVTVKNIPQYFQISGNKDRLSTRKLRLKSQHWTKTFLILF